MNMIKFVAPVVTGVKIALICKIWIFSDEDKYASIHVTNY